MKPGSRTVIYLICQGEGFSFPIEIFCREYADRLVEQIKSALIIGSRIPIEISDSNNNPKAVINPASLIGCQIEEVPVEATVKSIMIAQYDCAIAQKKFFESHRPDSGADWWKNGDSKS